MKPRTEIARRTRVVSGSPIMRPSLVDLDNTLWYIGITAFADGLGKTRLIPQHFVQVLRLRVHQRVSWICHKSYSRIQDVKGSQLSPRHEMGCGRT